MSGERNGHPCEQDALDALTAYTAHRVQKARQQADALEAAGTRTRQADEEALAVEAAALQNTLDILNAPEEADMSNAAPPAEPKPAPEPKPQPQPAPAPKPAPRPSAAKLAKERQEAIDKAIAGSVTLWPVTKPPEPRWGLLRLGGGAGELRPPPALPVSEQEFDAFVRQADEAERSLVELIRQQAGALPEAARCRESAKHVDGLLGELGRLRDAEASTCASVRHALQQGKVDKLPRLAESRNATVRQIELIEAELPALQRQHAALCRQLLGAVRTLAQQAVAVARQEADAAQRGWSRDETLTAVLGRVGPSAVLSGRLGGPLWADSQAVQAAEMILNGPLPQLVPEPTPAPPAKRPDFGLSPPVLGAKP
jgi:hypothetical protein